MIGIFSDIDGTMLGDPASLEELNARIKRVRDKVRLVYASGRSFPECVSALDAGLLLHPDAFIAYTGSAIFFDRNGGFVEDKEWENIINTGGWNAEDIRRALYGTDGLTLQPAAMEYKISYFARDGSLESAAGSVRRKLRDAAIKARVITSHGIYLDILPENCDKGMAAEYTAGKFGIGKDDAVVAGDSGNDTDMFSRFRKGIIVGNAREEMTALLKDSGHYRAKAHYASGVLEGLKHYFPSYF